MLKKNHKQHNAHRAQLEWVSRRENEEEEPLHKALALDQESVAAALDQKEFGKWADEFNGVQIVCKDVYNRQFVIALMVVPFATEQMKLIRQWNVQPGNAVVSYNIEKHN